jgi:hypothetical protein
MMCGLCGYRLRQRFAPCLQYRTPKRKSRRNSKAHLKPQSVENSAANSGENCMVRERSALAGAAQGRSGEVLVI